MKKFQDTIALEKFVLGLIEKRQPMKAHQIISAVDAKFLGHYNWRRADRAIQSLRRAGKIRFDTKKGWSVK